MYSPLFLYICSLSKTLDPKDFHCVWNYSVRILWSLEIRWSLICYSSWVPCSIELSRGLSQWQSCFDWGLFDILHCKKYGVHPFGKQVVNIWKRSIIHAFSDIFRKENPTFSRCFRVGKLEYSFHYPAIFLHSELYENDCFLSVKSTVNRRENSLYSIVYWCFPSNKTLFSQTFSVEDNAFSSIF